MSNIFLWSTQLYPIFHPALQQEADLYGLHQWCPWPSGIQQAKKESHQESGGREEYTLGTYFLSPLHWTSVFNWISQSLYIIILLQRVPLLNLLFSYYINIIILETESSSVAQARVQGHNLGHCNLHLLSSSDSPASASWVAGITGARHHTRLIFVFLVETGFCYIDQAGLELLGSIDLPTLASQSARTIMPSLPFILLVFLSNN